jgi:hypothetical protein
MSELLKTVLTDETARSAAAQKASAAKAAEAFTPWLDAELQ